jgi:hypothetical protein
LRSRTPQIHVVARRKHRTGMENLTLNY